MPPSELPADVWLVALVPIVLGVALSRLALPVGRSFCPRVATWTLTTTAVVIAGSSVYALATIASVAIGHIDLVADIGHWAPSALIGPAGAPIDVARVASVVLGLLAVAALAVLARAVRQLTRVERSLRRPGASPLLVVASDDVDAYAVGGITGGQIVVTTGVLATLSPGDRSIVLAHEHAHIAMRHHLFKTVATVSAGLNPLLRPVVPAVEECTERWADEYAADEVGDRRAVAEALARTALAMSASRSTGVCGFAQSAVVARVQSLVGARRPRPSLLMVWATLVVISLVATLVASHDTEGMFEHAQHTYAVGSSDRV